MPPGRDAEDPEPSRALGDASDHHSGRAREGCRISAYSVRAEGSTVAAIEASTFSRPEGFRVRHRDRSLSGHDPHGVGVAGAAGARLRTDAHTGARPREPRAPRRNRFALARPAT